MARRRRRVADQLRIREQMRGLAEIEHQLQSTQERQISLTDPDARSMATSRLGSAVVGYNVQTAVDAKHAASRYGVSRIPSASSCLHCWEPSIARLPPFSASTSTPTGAPPNLA
jgi:hypothetical protein